MGKQLSMEKKLHEDRIMKEALLKDLDSAFKHLEYCQKVVESNHQTYVSLQDAYGKIGQKLADAKFYYLSATFVLAKDIEGLKSTTLKEHMEANRPPDVYTSTPRTPFLTYDMIGKVKVDILDKVRPYKKYLTGKFNEYLGYCMDKLNESLKLIDKDVIPNYR